MSTLDDLNSTTPPPVPPDRVTAKENPSDATDVEGASKELKDLGEPRSDMSDYTENRSQDQVLDAPVTTPADVTSPVSADSSFSAESADGPRDPFEDIEGPDLDTTDMDRAEAVEAELATLYQEKTPPDLERLERLVGEHFLLTQLPDVDTTRERVLRREQWADAFKAKKIEAMALVNARPDVGGGKKALYQSLSMQKTYVDSIAPRITASILARTDRIVMVESKAGSDRSEQIMAEYQPDGPFEGTYLRLKAGSADFLSLVKTVVPSATSSYARAVYDELVSLSDLVPSVRENTDRDVLLFANGLVHIGRARRERDELAEQDRLDEFDPLEPFDPDVVRLFKSPYRLLPSYERVEVTSLRDDGTDPMQWEVVDGIREWATDDKSFHNLMRVVRCAINPMEAPHRCILLYGTGRNGKGTFCELLRHIIGPDRCSAVPIHKFEEDTQVIDMVGRAANIVDELPASGFIRETDRFKALTGGGPVTAHELYTQGVTTFTFSGLLVQCANEMPTSRDKSLGFIERFLPIAFDQCFPEDTVARRDIQAELIGRTDVLESLIAYVLWVEDPDRGFQLSERMQELKGVMRREGQPLETWVDEVLPELLEDGYEGYTYSLLQVFYQSETQHEASQTTVTRAVKKWIRDHPDCGWGVAENTTSFEPLTRSSSWRVEAHAKALFQDGWGDGDLREGCLARGRLGAKVSVRTRGIVRTRPMTITAARALGDKETVARIEAEAQAAKVATQAAKQELIDVSARALARARSYEPVPALPTSGPAVGDTSVMRPCDMTREDCFAELPRLRKVMKAVEEEVKDIEEDIKKAAEADMPECGLLDDRHKEVDTRRKEVMGQLLNLERNAGRFSHLASLPEDRYVEFLEVEAALVREQAPAPEAPARRDTDATGEPSLHVYHVYELSVGGLVAEAKRLHGLLAHAKANGEPVIDLGAQLEVLLREVSLRLGFMRGIPSLRGLFDDDIKKLESVVADQDAPPVLTEPDLPAALVRYLHSKASVPAAPAHRDTAALDVDDLDEDECRIEVARLRKAIGENSRHGVPVTNLEPRRDAVEDRLGHLVAQRDADEDSDEPVSAPPTSAGSDD